jgi:surface polysaccharide O-acyltransferase-like enzyme
MTASESRRPALPLSSVAAPYLIYADVMRAVAAVLVVWAHMACAYLYRPVPPAVTTSDWYAANWMLAISRPCVPLFVMLSGLLLLRNSAQPLSGQAFFQKRIVRVLVPFLLWTVAFVIWRRAFNGEAFPDKEVLKAFIRGTVSPHLWFMYMILGLYILTPVIQVYVRSATWRDYCYFIGLWSLVCVIMPAVQFLTHQEVYLFSFLGMSGFAGYYLSGHFLSQVKVPLKWRPWLAGLVVVGTVITALITEVLSKDAGKISDYFYSYLSPNVVLLSIACFLLLKDLPYDQLQQRAPWFYPALKTVSSLSLGIYLVHPMVMGVLESNRLGFTLSGSTTLSPAIVVPIGTLIVTLLSMVVSAILRKIPKVGKFLC